MALANDSLADPTGLEWKNDQIRSKVAREQASLPLFLLPAGTKTGFHPTTQSTGHDVLVDAPV